jgi:hypothetical protein
MPKAAAVATAPFADGDEDAALEGVRAWLRRHALVLPPALVAAAVAARAARDDAERGAAVGAVGRLVPALFPALRERERRALVRLVARAATPRPAAAVAGADSSSSDDDGDADGVARTPPVSGGAWPAGVAFGVDLRWPAGAEALRARYEPAGARARKPRPARRVAVRRIAEPRHPAHGELGLYAARDLPAGARACDYVGEVRPARPAAAAAAAAEAEGRAPAPPASDYELDFGLDSAISLDAAAYGNEGRFVNDYRNTGAHPNVEFRLRTDRRGALRQGIYVCAREGVPAGAELLVSYGKAYWRARVPGGSLDAFVTRRPGEP